MSNSLPSDFVFLKETFDKIGERNNREDFNPLRVINRQTNEVTHSDILAYLFKNEMRGISGLKNFLKRLVDLEIINSFQDFNDAWVKREWENIDLFIDIEEIGLAVGIENKLFSGERERQLEDYQKVLKEKCRGRKRILLFLTPNGRAPETADVDHEIPCYSISYQDILEVIDREDAIGSYGDFLRMFKNHLEVNIIMDEELKTEIRKFWGNPEYREKLQYLNSYRPMITEIKEPYEYKVSKYLSENYNDKAEVYIYPEKKEMQKR